jgi:UDP-N-acetylmuramoyl-tripeptide--D-alanyl-D-alanine ligase
MATPIPDNRARFTLDEVAAATSGRIARRGPAFGEGVTSDSRAVRAGAIFVALRGENHDGHDFAAAAARAGAAIVVALRGRDAEATIEGASVVEVDDTLVAWGELARAHLERWRAAGARGEARRVVAITGSAGKTTTKELTAKLLGAIAPCHFTAGNLNNRIGVPAVVFALGDAHRFCVLEMGMSLPGEIAQVARIARPDVAVVVNVGLAHAEGVGGKEGVMREKGAVYRALPEGGVAVVNADDPLVIRAADEAAPRSRVTFGAGAGADYRLVARSPLGAAGARVTLTRGPGGEPMSVTLPIPGEAAAIDLAAALAAQEAVSGEALSPARIDAALAGLRLEGRSMARRLDGDTLLLDDTYNANPGSVRAALSTLRELGEGRRLVVVLGEMKELGEHAQPEHEALGDPIADAGVALAIGCGGLVDLALARAGARGVEVVFAKDTAAAAREAAARVRPGDAILVKGSRSVGADRVVAALVRDLGETPEVLPMAPNSASSPGS